MPQWSCQPNAEKRIDTAKVAARILKPSDGFSACVGERTRKMGWGPIRIHASIAADAVTLQGITVSVREEILSYLEKRLKPNVYETWCRKLEFSEIDGNSVQIPVPNIFYRDWLERELRAPLEEAFGRLFGRVPTLVFKVVDSGTFAPTRVESKPVLPVAPVAPMAPSPIPADGARSNLNSKYGFDNFVVGPSNRFAHAAAQAVSEKPAGLYNPLFIHGGVGLGKTHLLQAICHATLARNPYTKIFYLSCEGFVNDYIAAVRKGWIDDFRRKYRNADLLVVDDVHFLEGKGGSQEEFFHTFNALHIAQRQIVLSSDQPANDIPTLKAHLMSRFAAGLEAKIESPTYEMRLAILQQKAEARGRELSSDVLAYIASTVQTNIRELEGAVTKVIAYSALVPGRTATIEVAREALRDTVAPRATAVNVHDIQEVVARYYGRTIADLQSRTWRKSTSLPRQVCIYLCRKFTNLSLAEIGEAFAGKNHATIIYSLRKVEHLLQSDTEVRADVDRLVRELQSQL